jgi:hypothetical protein
MASPSGSFDGTRISGAESETDGGTWDKWGAAQSPTQETDFVYQGDYAMSNKVSATTGGVDFDKNAPAIDMATTPRAAIMALMVSNYGAIDYTVAKGTAYQIGSGPGAYYDYYIHGLYNAYQKIGGWLLLVIDPNVAAYRDAQVGTPDLTTVDYFGWWADMAGSAKSENVIHDTLSYFDVGKGLTLVAGDGASEDCTFQDFVDLDEGTDANSWGLVSTREGVLYALGVLTIGSLADATEFTDSDVQVVFPDGLFDAGFCGLDINLENPSTDVEILNCQFVGRGREAIVQDFHTNDDVDATDDELDITGHNYETGDYVDYSKQGGSDSMGLTDGNDYWVRRVSADAISLHTTRQGAFGDTDQVDLSQSGGTETHRLTKLTDTRPDMEVVGVSGQATLDGSSFLNHRHIVFQSGAAMEGGVLECKYLEQNDADIHDVKIVTSAIPAVACIQDPVLAELTDLHDISFVQDTRGGLKGHALELSSGSYDFYGLTFSGYGSIGSDQAAVYVSAVTGTIIINVFGGDSPTYRTAGATVSIVVEPVTTEITVKDPNDVIVENARVLVEASDNTGDLPYQDTVTIVRSGTVATVTHTGHGLDDGDKVVIRGADQQEYNGPKSIYNVTANTYDYTVAGAPDSPATGTIKSTGVVVYGLTNAQGKISASRSFSVNQNVKGTARKTSATPYLKARSFTDVVNKTSGLTKTVQLESDE